MVKLKNDPLLRFYLYSYSLFLLDDFFAYVNKLKVSLGHTTELKNT